MSITIDDPTRPISAILSVGLACLLGLAVVGYIAILAWLKERSVRARWPRWGTQLALGLHFLLGIAVITLVPASLLHRLKAQGANSAAGGIAFLVTVLALIGLASFIARDWSVWFRAGRNPSASGRRESDE